MTYKDWMAFVVVACAACSAMAQAPLEKLKYGLKAERSVLDAQLCKVDHLPDFDNCLEKALEAAKTNYMEFSKLVKGKEKKGLIKSHYIALVSQLKGVEPEDGELKIVYQRRQSELKLRTDEAWMKFDLE